MICSCVKGGNPRLIFICMLASVFPEPGQGRRNPGTNGGIFGCFSIQCQQHAHRQPDLSLIASPSKIPNWFQFHYSTIPIFLSLKFMITSILCASHILPPEGVLDLEGRQLVTRDHGSVGMDKSYDKIRREPRSYPRYPYAKWVQQGSSRYGLC